MRTYKVTRTTYQVYTYFVRRETPTHAKAVVEVGQLELVKNLQGVELVAVSNIPDAVTVVSEIAPESLEQQEDAEETLCANTKLLVSIGVPISEIRNQLEIAIDEARGEAGIGAQV